MKRITTILILLLATVPGILYPMVQSAGEERFYQRPGWFASAGHPHIQQFTVAHQQGADCAYNAYLNGLLTAAWERTGNTTFLQRMQNASEQNRFRQPNSQWKAHIIRQRQFASKKQALTEFLQKHISYTRVSKTRSGDFNTLQLPNGTEFLLLENTPEKASDTQNISVAKRKLIFQRINNIVVGLLNLGVQEIDNNMLRGYIHASLDGLAAQVAFSNATTRTVTLSAQDLNIYLPCINSLSISIADDTVTMRWLENGEQRTQVINYNQLLGDLRYGDWLTPDEIVPSLSNRARETDQDLFQNMQDEDVTCLQNRQFLLSINTQDNLEIVFPHLMAFAQLIRNPHHKEPLRHLVIFHYSESDHWISVYMVKRPNQPLTFYVTNSIGTGHHSDHNLINLYNFMTRAQQPRPSSFWSSTPVKTVGTVALLVAAYYAYQHFTSKNKEDEEEEEDDESSNETIYEKTEKDN